MESMRQHNIGSGGGPKFGGNKAAGYGNRTYSGKGWQPYMVGGGTSMVGHSGNFKADGTPASNTFDLGRIKRTVWSINPQPLSEAHFAAYPEELCETPIKATCPEWICNKCNKPREIIYEEKRINTRVGLDVGNGKSGTEQDPNAELHNSDLSRYRQEIVRKEKSLSDCGCNAGWHSGIVLDCFFGAGTTGLVALKMARNFIGIELSEEYIKISRKRLEPYLNQARLF